MRVIRTVYRFKLRPTTQQEATLLDWRSKVRAFVNFCSSDRISSYEQAFVCGSYCELESNREVLVCPLACSVNRSASVGYPWRSGEPKLRRAKDKSKPPNPRRSAYEMHSAYLTEMKQARPWYKTVSTDVLQQALLNLDKAFQNFFSGKAKFPRFKRTIDINFEFKPATVRIDGNNITFPVLGKMRFYQSRQIPKSWAVKTCTISVEPDGFYVSVLLEDKTVPDIPLKKDSELRTVVGADVGITKIVSTSDGETIPNPRFLKKHQRRLVIRQRSLSRKKKGSNNKGKAGKLVARVHQAIRRERNDYTWKLARKLADKADVIAFEDLNIKGMIKRCKPKKDEATGKYLRNGQNRKAGLNKAIADASWHALRLKTQYIKLWDVETGVQESTLTGHGLQVTSVALTPCGKFLASGSFDRTVRLWELSSGWSCTFEGHSWAVFAVAFSPDGKTLATGSGDNTIILWDWTTRKVLYTLVGHSWSVVAVAFSPDGETLATGSWDKTIQLWQVSTGKEIGTLAGHLDSVSSVAISPSGEIIASGSKDKTIKLWHQIG